MMKVVPSVVLPYRLGRLCQFSSFKLLEAPTFRNFHTFHALGCREPLSDHDREIGRFHCTTDFFAEVEFWLQQEGPSKHGSVSLGILRPQAWFSDATKKEGKRAKKYAAGQPLLSTAGKGQATNLPEDREHARADSSQLGEKQKPGKEGETRFEFLPSPPPPQAGSKTQEGHQEEG